jgi:hypothetical protein
LKYFHFIIWWYVNYSNNYIFARRYTYFNENSFNYIFYICFKVFTNIILQLFWNIYTNTVGFLCLVFVNKLYSKYGYIASKACS